MKWLFDLLGNTLGWLLILGVVGFMVWKLYPIVYPVLSGWYYKILDWYYKDKE